MTVRRKFVQTDGVLDIGTGNLEAEMLNARSVVRQLVDQMTLAKAYVVIAKENSNYVYAWELGTQIRACQRLLSVAKLGKTIELKEAAPVINEMAAVLAQAHVLHYDSATMILKLKAQLQVCLTSYWIQSYYDDAGLGMLNSLLEDMDLHPIQFNFISECFCDTMFCACFFVGSPYASMNVILHLVSLQIRQSKLDNI